MKALGTLAVFVVLGSVAGNVVATWLDLGRKESALAVGLAVMFAGLWAVLINVENHLRGRIEELERTANVR